MWVFTQGRQSFTTLFHARGGEAINSLRRPLAAVAVAGRTPPREDSTCHPMRPRPGRRRLAIGRRVATTHRSCARRRTHLSTPEMVRRGSLVWMGPASATPKRAQTSLAVALHSVVGRLVPRRRRPRSLCTRASTLWALVMHHARLSRRCSAKPSEARAPSRSSSTRRLGRVVARRRRPSAVRCTPRQRSGNSTGLDLTTACCASRPTFS